MSMVATGFATCGHDRRRLAAYDLGQVLGGAAGGSLVGLLLGAVALAIAMEARGAPVVAAMAAVASLASGSLVAAWAAWTAYGVTRALAPVVTRRLGVDSNGIAGFTDRTRPAMLASGALASVAAACLSLIRL